jgi:hypothetical protein
LKFNSAFESSNVKQLVQFNFSYYFACPQERKSNFNERHLSAELVVDSSANIVVVIVGLVLGHLHLGFFKLIEIRQVLFSSRRCFSHFKKALKQF